MDMLPRHEPSTMGSLLDQGLAKSGFQGPDPGQAPNRGVSALNQLAGVRLTLLHRKLSPFQELPSPLTHTSVPCFSPNPMGQRAVISTSGQPSTLLFPCFP